MAEKVGLIAVLDMGQFNRNFASYTRALNSMNSQSVSTARSIDNSFLTLGNSINRISNDIAVKLVAGLAAAGTAITAFVGSGIKQAANLEAQLDGINAILGNTEEQSQAVKQAVLDLGINPNLKVTALEAAQAVELLARNGLDTNEIIGETGDIMDSAAFSAILLANATGADFGLAADIATDAMAIFNLEAEDMIDVVNGIVGVVNNSKFTIQDYNLLLRNGGAAAAFMNVSLEDFNTVAAISAEELGKGQKAGTGFANFINRLTPNTNTATAAMKDLNFIMADGTNVFFDAEGKLKDMNEVTRILNQSLFGTQEVMVEVGGRTAEQNRVLSQLQSQYKQAQLTIADYQAGVKGITLDDDARNKKIEEQQELMAALTPRIQELTGIRGDLITTTKELTDEERSAALEAIFGRDAMATVIALAKEGEPAFTDVATAMKELGVSQEEATRIVEEGTTAYEIMFDAVNQTDAVDQAAQRMDNLKGVIEILKGVIESIQLQIGDLFIPMLTELGRSLLDIVSEIGPKVISFFNNMIKFVQRVVESIDSGVSPLKAFDEALRKFGLSELANNFRKITPEIQKFITPIIEFVQKHSEGFIGALTAIGHLGWVAAIIARIASVIGLLFSPITLIISVVGLLGAAWETNFGGIQDIVNNTISKIAPVFETIVKAIKDFISTVKSGGSPITAFFDAMENVGFSEDVVLNIRKVVNTLRGLFNLLSSGNTTEAFKVLKDNLSGIDFASIGQSISTGLINAFGTVGTFLGETISGWIIALTEWVNTVDWFEVGKSIVDLWIAGLGLLLGWIQTQVTAWATAIVNFASTADWSQIGLDIITAIGNGLLALVDGIATATVEWTNKLLEWANADNWMEFGLTIVTFILSGLGNFLVLVQEKFIEWTAAFVTWIGETDWLQLGIDIVTFIIGGLVTFNIAVLTTLAGWSQSFFSWLVSVDWLQIGSDIVTFILNGLGMFVDLIGAVFTAWFDTFVAFVTETDWMQVGKDIVEFVIDGLETFGVFVIDTYAGWLQSLTDWVVNTEWDAVGEDIVNFILNGLELWYIEIPIILQEWANEIFTWIIETDFRGEGEKIVAEIITGLTLFVAQVGITLISWWNEFKNWFMEQDWGSLAKTAIDGIIAGLKAGATAIGKAVGDLVKGMSNAWNERTDSSSPSRLFMSHAKDVVDGVVVGIQQNSGRAIAALGQMAVDADDLFEQTWGDITDIGVEAVDHYRSQWQDIIDATTDGLERTRQEIEIFDPLQVGIDLGDALVQGLTASLEEGQQLIQQLFDVGGELSSIGGVFGRIFDEREVKPLEDRIKGFDREIKDSIKGPLKDALKRTGSKSLDELRQKVANFPGILQPGELQALQAITDIEDQRVRTMQELTEKQEKLIQLQKQQQDLQILEQQFKLLELITEHGLDAQALLGGMELGLDASLPDLIQVMTNAMQQVIAAAEGELQIQSPSKIFERIGQLTIGGFIPGVKDMIPAAVNTMREFTGSIINSVGSSPIVNNNQRSKTIQLEVNNDFASQPQITDRSQLELLLASFV